MFQYFPKIEYQFFGLTLNTVDIFKQVNIIFDKPDALTKTQIRLGERPDQISQRLYNTPNNYWMIFLANNIKNPFTEWAQTQEAYVNNIETRYAGWNYQFGNVSIFNPSPGITGFTGNNSYPYEGTNLNEILPGDLIIYETGSGPFSVKCYGAGGITSENSCGSPHFGQSIVPDEFNNQTNVVQVSAGNYFTSCLDSSGYVYVWGKEIGIPTTAFTKINTLYKSKTGGYLSIEASGERLILVNYNGNLECYGSCTDFNTYYDNTSGFVKTAWTAGLSGGIAIKSDKTVTSYGITAPANLYDADCGDRVCVGIDTTNYGITVFGFDTGDGVFTVPGVTGITMISLSHKHAVALGSDGSVYSWGSNSDGQTDVSGTYSKVSAGRYHTAALDNNGNLKIWGKITKQGDSNCSGLTLIKVSPIGLSGSHNLINSGYDHIVLKGSGTNKKYVGVIDSVDAVYKRIFVTSYQFFNNISSMLFNDPSGTMVSIWRYSGNRYVQIKTIQNQFLGLQKYLDSTKYIKQAGNILDGSTSSVWKDIYLSNYKTAEENEEFITPRKELMDIDLVNKRSVNKISQNTVGSLTVAIQNILDPNSTTDEIRISEL